MGGVRDELEHWTKPLCVDRFKRYYWHLTDDDLSDDVILTPKSNRESSHRSWDEADLRRVCVSLHPVKCFAAIPLNDYGRHYLYRTCNKVLARYPRGICDAKITGERWLTRDINFKLVRVFTTSDMAQISKMSDRATNKILGYKSNIDIGSTDEEQLECQREFIRILLKSGMFRGL